MFGGAQASGAVAARAKIDAVLPQSSGARLSGSTIGASRRASGRAPANATMLRRAVRTHIIVEFDYHSEQSQPANRLLRPIALTAFTDCWTISGWCETRQALRNFRLDRIGNLKMTDDTFDGIPHHHNAGHRTKAGYRGHAP
jgi:predicted DNA-binding transcriptional regulator YafY